MKEVSMVHRIAASPLSAWGSSVISVAMMAMQQYQIESKSSLCSIRASSSSPSSSSLLASIAYARASHRNLHASYYIPTEIPCMEQSTQTSAGGIRLDETNNMTKILCVLRSGYKLNRTDHIKPRIEKTCENPPLRLACGQKIRGSGSQLRDSDRGSIAKNEQISTPHSCYTL